MSIRQVGRRLTPKEAETLWRARHEDGDSDARERLIFAYSPLVDYLAARHCRHLPQHYELDDIVSIGLIALIESIKSFRPERGASFEQYAWTRVAGAMIDELRHDDRVTRSTRARGRELEKARNRWISRHGRSPSELDLAAELQVGVAEVRRCQAELARATVVSLNAPVRIGQDDCGELGETVPDGSRRCDPVEMALVADQVERTKEAISRLSERERNVIRLVHVEERTGVETAQILQLHESRVSQILSEIRDKVECSLNRRLQATPTR
jgi:RNA polymerase sigma factor for flagellar operon FliA